VILSSLAVVPVLSQASCATLTCDGTFSKPGGHATAFGTNTNASGLYSVAFGFGSTASEDYSVAIGHQATAGHVGSVAIGTNAETTAELQLSTSLSLVAPTVTLTDGGDIGAGDISKTIPAYVAAQQQSVKTQVDQLSTDLSALSGRVDALTTRLNAYDGMNIQSQIDSKQATLGILIQHGQDDPIGNHKNGYAECPSGYSAIACGMRRTGGNNPSPGYPGGLGDSQMGSMFVDETNPRQCVCYMNDKAYQGSYAYYDCYAICMSGVSYRM